MSKKQDKVVEPPGLQDISDLFPPSASSSSPVAANISMKLPVFSATSLDLSASGSISSLSLPCSPSALPSSPCSSIPPFTLYRCPIWSPPSSAMCLGSPQLLVPTALRHQLFLSLQRLSHPGVRASWRLLSSKFVWPGLWTQYCLRFQQSKISHKWNLLFLVFKFPKGGFHACIWIWWGPCLPARVLVTF